MSWYNHYMLLKSFMSVYLCIVEIHVVFPKSSFSDVMLAAWNHISWGYLQQSPISTNKGLFTSLFLRKLKVTQLCPTLRFHGLHSPWNSPGRNTGVGSLSLLQGISPTQGSNPSLPHCRWILYQLSHKGSPRILGWVAYPFSRGSSQPRNRTRVSCIVGDFFINWAIREAQGASN